MATFEFCKIVEDEYTNPTNRRYHAQPVACEICGPNITFV